MDFKWDYQGPRQSLQKFLRQEGFSLTLMSKMKYHGGMVFVNHRQRNTTYQIRRGDAVFLRLPPEHPADSVVATPGPIDVVFEDRDLLIVNKPAGTASIPAANRQPDSMANFVKYYLQTTGVESTAVHVVTRLDRDTSGLMIFAKHSMAHSLLDRQLHSPSMRKEYLAISSGDEPLAAHGWMIMRLGLSDEFYMRRAVTPAGKKSVTEYWTLAQSGRFALSRVLLHTGRTHQIRVHFAAINRPLVGDELYGGGAGVGRQALHCAALTLRHPYTGVTLRLTAPMPADMRSFAQAHALM